MHVSAYFAVAGGVATLASYVCLWLAVGNADRWFGPFSNHKTAWGLYTATTVAAYFAVVWWMVSGPDDPVLYWLAAAFNWSASLWVPATAFDFTYGTKLSFVSVVATAACSIAWTVGAQSYHPPAKYNIAFAALLVHHIAADAVIWGRVYLKSTFKRPMGHTDSALAKAQHVVSAVIHIGSAISLIVAAAASGPLADFDRPIKERPSQNDWRFTCATDNSCTCPSTDRIFYIESAGTTHTIPIVWCAFLFAFWSGAWHLITVAAIRWAPEARANNVLLGPIAVRTWDYAISASLMILVVNTLFGAATPAGTVVSPSLQAIIVLLGGGVEQFARDYKPKGPNQTTVAIATVGFLFALYAVEWSPTFYALQKATESNKAECVGTAPPVVGVFLAFIFAIFSAFPVIWAWFVVKVRKATPETVNGVIDSREFVYNIVSCIAKLTLHAFIGIALFGQKNMVSFTEHNLPERPNDAGQEGQAYAAAFGIVGGVVGVNVAIWAKYRTRETTRLTYKLVNPVRL
jgi:hypothetical protein